MPVEPTAIQIELANAIKRFQSFGGADLTKALSSIESELASNTIDTCESALAVAGATAEVLGAAVAIIDGIDVMVAQTLVSEVGLDMSRWKTEAHFASWLGLCPDNRISGDKVLSKGTRGVVNRAATALRQAASTLLRSRSYLGAQYRRLRIRLGAPKAITAMAHRLARLVYRMLKFGQAYVDKGTEYYEIRFREQQVHLLRKRAAKLGLQVAPISA